MLKISLLECFKNIFKNKYITCLAVFIFSTLFLLQGYTYSYYLANSEVNGIMDLVASSEYQIYRFSSRYPARMVYTMEGYKIEEYRKELSEFYQELDKIEKLYYDIGWNASFTLINNGSEFFKGEDVRRVEAIKCCPNFHEVENYKIIEGRNLTAEDSAYIKGEPRAALLGYKLKDYFNVGDIISVETNDLPENNTYYFDSIEVVGFLGEDSTYFNQSGDNIYDLDRMIVFPGLWIPYEKRHDYDEPVEKNALNSVEGSFEYTKLFIKAEDEAEVFPQIQEALNGFLTMGKYFRPLKVGLTMEKIESETAAVTELSSIITSILMVFAFVTVLISVVNRVLSNVKDYSIHIVLGMSKGNIVGFILCEMSVLLISSIIIGTVATRLVTKFLYMNFDLIKFVGLYIVTSVLVLTLSVIITILLLRKHDVCTYIK